MSDILRLIREDLHNFMPYRSYDKVKSKETIFLNSNEMPFETKLTITTHVSNRYHEPQPLALRSCLAKLYQVNPEEILLTRGSDEGIDLLIRLFCRAGKDAVITCPPTFGMYGIVAQLQNVKNIEVPIFENNFQLNITAILQQCTQTTKLVFLCSPNNPTGNRLSMKDILYLCKQLQNKAVVIVDEAYVEFSAEESLSRYIDDYPNLVILRTLSKAYGLAAVRLGCVLANSSLIQWLNKITMPYPLADVVVQAAFQRLEENNLLSIQQQVKIIIQEKIKLVKNMQDLLFVKHVWPSEANFILVRVNNAALFINYCEQQNIVIRDMSTRLYLTDCVRISIGTPEQNQRLFNTMGAFNDEAKISVY